MEGIYKIQKVVQEHPADLEQEVRKMIVYHKKETARLQKMMRKICAGKSNHPNVKNESVDPTSNHQVVPNVTSSINPPSGLFKSEPDLGSDSDSRNPFLHHFETGFDALCAKNRHLVLTILNGCNKIDDVRERLNSQKGHFDEEEGLEIWEQCLKYATEELFPFYEEGGTGGIDHLWAMGIIMAYILCGYPALKGTEDIQCYNNVETLKLNGHTFPPKQWCNLTPEARKHIKECIHFNPGNRPCLTSLWFNEWCTTTEEANKEKYRRRYIEETNDVKEQNKETEKNKIKDNWNLFMNKATKQSMRKKQKLKQLANKEKREEEDGNERNIVHWLHLYEKRWN
eukprot:jgi/Psemu1/39544/gm1.39544_g